MKKASCTLLIDKLKKKFLSVSLKDDKTDANLPGGKVEPNETYKQAAIRELKEETGLNILEKDLIKFQEEIEVRTVFRILIQLYVSIKMKENESKSKQN